MRVFLIGLSLFTATSALAQQQPSTCPTLPLVQSQRNQFLDSFNEAAVKIDTLTAELAKANARIKELEPKSEPKEDK